MVRKSVFLRLLGQIRHKWLYIVSMVVLSILPFSLNFVFANFFREMLASIQVRDLARLYSDLIFTVKIIGLMLILFPVATYCFEFARVKTTAAWRRRVFAHAQRLPLSYRQKHHSGDLISRLTNDISVMEGAYGAQLRQFLTSLISGVASIFAMLWVNWKLTLIILAFSGGITLANTLLARPMRRLSQKVQEGLASLTELLTNTAAGAVVIRLYDMTTRVNREYRRKNREVLDLAHRRVLWLAGLNAVNSLGSFVGFWGVVVLGGVFVLRGEAQFGDLIFLVQMQNNVVQLFNSIGNLIVALQSSLAGAERVLEIIDLPPEPEKYEVQPVERRTEKDSSEVAIGMYNVSFAYDSEEKVLDGLSFVVPRGQVYGLVGPSGAGKSTVLKLLLGFHPPQGGDIEVDGLLLSDTSLRKIRERVAYVSQDVYLFSGTVAENIAYGREGASFAEIQAAARAAYAHDFILGLPDGYDTQVGERGAHLSGGQKQRIAIARALLKDAPILLLDEATSALDTESEELVQKALEVLMEGKTTLVVAHRLSTIQNADQILVLNEGRIVETGTHQELLQTEESLYRHLYELQFARKAAS